MRPNLTLASILRPLIIGLVALGVGIGLTVYYTTRDNATAISYVFSAIVIAAGAVMVGSAIMTVFRLRLQMRIAERGTPMRARYASHKCKYQSSKSALYQITFTNEQGEQYVSPAQYGWEDVLAIKSAAEVTMLRDGKHWMLTEDLQQLRQTHAQEIERLSQVYDRAIEQVQQMHRKPDDAIGQRNRNTAVVKRQRIERDDSQRPSAQDDAQADRQQRDPKE